MEQILRTLKIVILLLNDFNALKLSDLSDGKNDVKFELFGTHGHEHECNTDFLILLMREAIPAPFLYKCTCKTKLFFGCGKVDLDKKSKAMHF